MSESKLAPVLRMEFGRGNDSTPYESHAAALLYLKKHKSLGSNPNEIELSFTNELRSLLISGFEVKAIDQAIAELERRILQPTTHGFDRGGHPLQGARTGRITTLAPESMDYGEEPGEDGP